MIRNIFCREQRRTDAGVGESEGLYPVLTPPTQMCNSPVGTFSGIHLESWLSNPDPDGIRKSATSIHSIDSIYGCPPLRKTKTKRVTTKFHLGLKQARAPQRSGGFDVIRNSLVYPATCLVASDLVLFQKQV